MIRNRTPGYAKRVIPKKRNRFLTPHGDVLKIHRNGGCSEWKGDIKKKKRACNKGELVYELPISGLFQDNLHGFGHCQIQTLQFASATLIQEA